MRYPLARPDITDREIHAVTTVLRGPDLSLGPKVTEFEDRFARYCQTRHAVAVSSGTAALHLVVRSMDLHAGDEVITTPFSFVASANCVLYENATPLFVDIDPRTWNIDPERVESAVGSKTKAILAVDVFGQPADYELLRATATRHGLRLIEDSCEALGSRFVGRPAGSLADAGVFGFYPNKQITTGEGGMIVTDDDEVAGMARSLRNQGREPGDGWLHHPRLGYNYRISDIACALGLVQLDRIDEIIARRRAVADEYQDVLADCPSIRLQQVDPRVEMSWFVFVIALDKKYERADRDRILTDLTRQGIGCSNYFAPIHLQPYMVERFGHRPGDFPVTESLADRTIALPFHAGLTKDDIATICRTLRDIMEKMHPS